MFLFVMYPVSLKQLSIPAITSVPNHIFAYQYFGQALTQPPM